MRERMNTELIVGLHKRVQPQRKKGIIAVPGHFLHSGHHRFWELVLDHTLEPLYEDPKCLIYSSPEGRDKQLKYVIDPSTGEALDTDLQALVLRGMKNQRAVEDLPGVQKTFSVGGFYENIPGLLHLERVQGTPFDNYLAEGKVFDKDWLYFFALKAGGTLNDVAAKGVEHRDVKPGNIINTVGFGVAFIDWSLAVNPTEHAHDEQEGGLYFTPPYAKLEDNTFGVRDKYGLALTLLEALATEDERRTLQQALQEANKNSVRMCQQGKIWAEQMLRKAQNRVGPEFYEFLHHQMHSPNTEYRRVPGTVQTLSDYDARHAQTHLATTVPS
jgi:serine/threonine protein kinase